MRPLHALAHLVCLLTVFSFAACDSGSPTDDDDDDGPRTSIVGTWRHELTGEGVTGRSTFTESGNTIGGSVQLYYAYPGPVVGTFPITGSRRGEQVEFEHDVLDGDADPDVMYHFEMTVTSIQQMSGTRSLTTGAVLDDDAYFVKEVVLPRP